MVAMLLKFVGPPLIVALVVVGAALFVKGLYGKIEGLERDLKVSQANEARLDGALDEQRQENTKLREDFARADEARKYAQKARDEDRAAYDRRVAEIAARQQETALEALENSVVSGDRANAWLANWMRRLHALAPGEAGEGDQGGAPGAGARLSSAGHAAADRQPRNLVDTLNAGYTDRLQDECDNSKFNEEGLVDAGRAGDPRFCNWYFIGFPGDRWNEFRLYMELVLLRVEDVYRYGDYYRAATRRFEDRAPDVVAVEPAGGEIG